MLTRVADLERGARLLGFIKVRQRGNHARWKHPDGRATTIPIHSSVEIGGWLYHEILKQLGVSDQEFERLSDKPSQLSVIRLFPADPASLL